MKSLEDHIVKEGIYDRIIIRRRTWDGCIGEQEYGPDGDRHITPTIEVAYKAGISRKYIFQWRRIEYRQKPYGGDDFTCLVAEYIEDI